MSWGDDDHGSPPRRWTVAQIGHREEYAAARAFAVQDRLARLYTDMWCRRGAALLRRGPAPARKLALRHHPTLHDQRVVAWTPTVLARTAVRALGRRRRGRTTGHTAHTDYHEYLRIGAWFDAAVGRQIQRQDLEPGRDVFFTYNTGCLETLRQLRERGITAIVDQIHPGRLEYDLMRAEAEKWPDWQASPLVIPDVYFERLEAESHAAAGVVVNSEWSADALVQHGVPRDRISVVPLAYEPTHVVERPRPAHDRPLTVLWLGNVILRKGIQYLVEAARLLTDRSIRIVVVGPVHISARAVASAPPSVEFRGAATHDRVSAAYAAADVFVLPTISDGFGLTQLEALAHGLPVVTTPNCGKVVDDGQDGLIVPAGDGHALAAVLAKLDDDRDLVAAMSERAPLKARQFSLERYRAALDAAADRLVAQGSSAA